MVRFLNIEMNHSFGPLIHICECNTNMYIGKPIINLILTCAPRCLCKLTKKFLFTSANRIKNKDDNIHNQRSSKKTDLYLKPDGQTDRHRRTKTQTPDIRTDGHSIHRVASLLKTQMTTFISNEAVTDIRTDKMIIEQRLISQRNLHNICPKKSDTFRRTERRIFETLIAASLLLRKCSLNNPGKIHFLYINHKS